MQFLIVRQMLMRFIMKYCTLNQVTLSVLMRERNDHLEVNDYVDSNARKL